MYPHTNREVVTAAAGVQRSQIARLDLGADSVVRKWSRYPLPLLMWWGSPCGNMTTSPGVEFNSRLSVQLDDSAAVDEEMVEDKMAAPGAKRRRHRFTTAARKSPRAPRTRR